MSQPCSKLLVIQIQMEETDNSKKDKGKKDTDKKDTNQNDKCKECMSPPCSKLLLISAAAVAAASLCRALQTIFSIYKC